MQQLCCMARAFLVAHDFSASADAAARLAVDDLRDVGGGTIILVHIYTVMPMPAFPEERFGLLHAFEHSNARQRLETIANNMMKRARDVPLRIDADASPGSPAEGILATAMRHHVDRIYVGTHGRHGLTHLLLGSVAEHVMRDAHVPVVVVKPA
jgi:nucleotide-binding universal stress UspA family protein